MEVIGNALELRAFDRMEEDIRLVGYFKNEDSERECLSFVLFLSKGAVCLALGDDRTALTQLICWIYGSIYTSAAPSCHSLVPTHQS